jgi:pimeloyl-ACP methyl ester carboxylesterase
MPRQPDRCILRIILAAPKHSGAEHNSREALLARFGRLVFCVCLLCACAAGQTGRDQFFESDGVRIRYQAVGEGPLVVLIHGMGGTLESWQRTGIVRVLSPHFRVVAMDLRGHGRSGKPHEPASYGPALAADVVRLLRHIGAAKAHVVGYSLGGLIALDVAAVHQEHALSVVVGGTGWPPPDAVNNFRRQAEAYETAKVPVREGDDPAALAALSRGLRVLSAEDVRAIKIPLAVIIGADDMFIADAQRLSRAVPKTEVVIIPATNHETAIWSPKFAEALLAFLRKQPVITQ